ncbi:hypothetical protein ACI65C_010208 [Semiaphis heraclei]
MINKGILRQFLAATAGSLSIMNVGIILGWTSPIMEELLGPDSPIPMTVDESSWFVSVIDWGLILGSLPFGVLADRWGRKPSLQIIGPMALATWVALLYVDSFQGLLAVRFTQGLLAAGAYTVLPVYAGEIAGPKIRGALGTMFQIMMYVGILYVYAAGMYLDYTRLTYAAMAGPVLFCALFATIPESPHFYVMKNRLTDAKQALVWLRGDETGSTVDDEMDVVVECICKEMRNASFTELFTDWVSLKALIIVQGLSVFRVMAGVTALISYASITFAEMHVAVDSNKLSLVFACSVLFSALPSTLLADRVGRRPLMIVSCASCFAFDSAIFAYFYVDRCTAYDVTDYGWLCVLAVGGLSIAHTLGLGSLLSTINCELFPSNTRSIANAVNTITLTVASFLALKIYPVLADDGGMYRNYLISSLFSLISIISCFLWLPETKGKTFAAIQAQLRKTDDLV